MEIEARDARSVLTATGGFLAGYTHSFNPGIGCSFAPGVCGTFCYARGFAERTLGRGSWGRVLVVKRNAATLLEAELARAGRRDPDHPHHVGRLRIFASSTTDPCGGPLLELTRACLRVVARHPVARWVLQTRSPRVVELEEEIVALGERVVVSFTLETDDASLWRRGPPGAPAITARRRAFERMAAWPVRRHLAVSPCLPLESPESFAQWIACHATDATVDTCVHGDGAKGRRTAASPFTGLAETWEFAWRDDAPARHLLALLRAAMPGRVGWSAEGFARLASV